MHGLAALLAVLVAAALLGVLVWIGGALALADLVSRPAITPAALVKTGVALAGAAVAYVVLVTLIGAAVAS